jgi:hypothetical protein
MRERHADRAGQARDVEGAIGELRQRLELLGRHGGAPSVGVRAGLLARAGLVAKSCWSWA